MTKFTSIQQQLVSLNAALRDEVAPHSVYQKGQRIWLVGRDGQLVQQVSTAPGRLPLHWELPIIPPFDPFAAVDWAAPFIKTWRFHRVWIEVSPMALASKDFVWPYEWPYDEPVYMERP